MKLLTFYCPSFGHFPFINSLLLVLLFPALLACSQQTGPGSSQPPSHLRDQFDPEWALDQHWDDGMAEVAVYEAERVIYGKPRQFAYTLITVKEDFNAEFNVKTDDYSRRDLYPVMKVNQFARIPTDNYPYHFLSSLFFRRENPVQLLKMTTGSQEWCGNTFKTFSDEGSHYRFAYNSYWDGQGDGQMQVEQDVLFEDQLPYTLRSLRFKEGLRLEAKVAENQQTNKATPPHIYQAVLVVEADRSPSEALPGQVWRVEVQLDEGKTNEYWFSQQPPHILLRQRTWDGRSLNLTSLERNDYWQH
jgi:hypothetical protein